MTTLSRSRSLIGLLALGAAALVASACDPATPYAAIVNGTRISQSRLIRELKAFRANAAFVTAYNQPTSGQGGAQPGLLGTNTAGSTFTQSFAAVILRLDVDGIVIHNEVLRRHIEPSAAAITDPATVTATGQGFPTDTQGKTTFTAFPAWLRLEFQQRQVDQDALARALAVPVTDASIQQFYDKNQKDFVSNQCVVHILVATQAQAAAIAGQLQAGGDFATLAAQNSLDSATAAKGGDLGCNAPGTGTNQIDVDQQFAQAAIVIPLNQVSPPLQVTQGWDVFKVTKRTIAPLTPALKQRIQQYLQQQSAVPLTQFLQTAEGSGKVQLNPIYGHWDAAQQSQIVPPPSPDPTKSGLPGVQTTPTSIPTSTPAPTGTGAGGASSTGQGTQTTAGQ